MTRDALLYRDRLNVFNNYLQCDISVTDLCGKFNRSRTWFNRWRPRYRAYGEDGVRDIERSLPAIPNRAPLEIEAAILVLSAAPPPMDRNTSRMNYSGRELG